MQSIKKILFVSATVIGLASCGGSSNDKQVVIVPEPEEISYTFEVTMQNITNNQPLSPFSSVSHAMDVSLWALGETATLGLEHSAESGDNTMLLDSVTNYDNASDDAPIMPGMMATIMVNTNDDNNYLSIISMLVNTNDAFTGLNQYDVSEFAIDETKSMLIPVYDAGTEGNSELAATLPGPVSSGEGFNAMRDDVDFVSRHSGVVSSDDGLTQSALDESHRFETMVAKVTIKRIN